MGQTTQLLAQIIAPTLIAIGLGLLVSKDYYAKVFKQIKEETLAMYIGATFTIMASTALLAFHNTWETLPEAVVTLIGVLGLIKGIGLAALPKFVEDTYSKIINPAMLNVAGVVALIIGLYLGWAGYLV